MRKQLSTKPARAFNELIRQQQQRSAEAATLFYYLNRTCFNGLCRFNRKNEFNVPFGRYKTINYTQDFAAYRPQLAGWNIAHHSFEYVEGRKNKGWAGHTLERYLGLPLNSLRALNFGS